MRPADRVPETRQVQIHLSVALDIEVAASIALHRGVAVEAVLSEIAGDCECRAHDSVRYRHGVVSVASRLAGAMQSR